MDWLAVIKLALSLLDKFTGYLSDRQLIDAGEAKAIRGYYEETLKQIEQARKARLRIHYDDTERMRNDKRNRDNK